MLPARVGQRTSQVRRRYGQAAAGRPDVITVAIRSVLTLIVVPARSAAGVR